MSSISGSSIHVSQSYDDMTTIPLDTQVTSAGAAAVAAVGTSSISATPPSGKSSIAAHVSSVEIDHTISTDGFSASRSEKTKPSSCGWEKMKEGAKAVGNFFLDFLSWIRLGAMSLFNMGVALVGKAASMCRSNPQNAQLQVKSVGSRPPVDPQYAHVPVADPGQPLPFANS